MSANNKPATALPWHLGQRQAQQIVYDSKGWAVANATVYHGEADKADTVKNARYLAHAASAYPELVAALRQQRGFLISLSLICADQRFSKSASRREFAEATRKTLDAEIDQVEALLAKLGEAA